MYMWGIFGKQGKIIHPEKKYKVEKILKTPDKFKPASENTTLNFLQVYILSGVQWQPFFFLNIICGERKKKKKC